MSKQNRQKLANNNRRFLSKLGLIYELKNTKGVRVMKFTKDGRSVNRRLSISYPNDGRGTGELYLTTNNKTTLQKFAENTRKYGKSGSKIKLLAFLLVILLAVAIVILVLVVYWKDLERFIYSGK